MWLWESSGLAFDHMATDWVTHGHTQLYRLPPTIVLTIRWIGMIKKITAIDSYAHYKDANYTMDYNIIMQLDHGTCIPDTKQVSQVHARDKIKTNLFVVIASYNLVGGLEHFFPSSGNNHQKRPTRIISKGWFNHQPVVFVVITLKPCPGGEEGQRQRPRTLAATGTLGTGKDS